MTFVVEQKKNRIYKFDFSTRWICARQRKFDVPLISFALKNIFLKFQLWEIFFENLRKWFKLKKLCQNMRKNDPFVKHLSSVNHQSIREHVENISTMINLLQWIFLINEENQTNWFSVEFRCDFSTGEKCWSDENKSEN